LLAHVTWRFLRFAVLTTKRIKVDKMFLTQTIGKVLDWKKSLTNRGLRKGKMLCKKLKMLLNIYFVLKKGWYFA